jgi:RNA polymerase sigma-70 factor (ECF subfamily)
MVKFTRDRETDSYLPTRESLLVRLKDWQDHEGWREFFDSYWRLIHNVARQSGLEDAAAQDVVQNTFIYLTRKMPNFHYEPARGSFKSWLRVVTRSRIGAYRRSARAQEGCVREPLPGAPDDGSDPLEQWPDPGGDALDEVWQREWEENLLQTAMRRLRARVSVQQLLIFRLATFGELPLTQIARKLGVNQARIYLARHRVGKLLKAEVQRLRRETE